MRTVWGTLKSGIIILGLASCTSSLVVRSDSATDADGLPFYLTEHHFVVTELGLAADGARTSNVSQKVELVTRPNKLRGYRISNRSSGFADSEFKLARDVQGGLVSVSGKTDDRTLEAVQALVATVKTAAMFAGTASPAGEEAALNDVEQELLRDLTRLTLELKGTNDAKKRSEKIEEIAKLEKTLGLVRARIQEIKVARAPKPGVGKSSATTPAVEVIDDRCEQARTARVQQLPQGKKGDIVVILVPADAKNTCP